MSRLGWLMFLAVVLAGSAARAAGVYRAPRPRPPATSGTLVRDATSGNYRLTYTDEEGQSYTIPVESRDRAVFELGVQATADTAYSSIHYSYRMKNAAPAGGGPDIFLIALMPCNDPRAAASSAGWSSEVDQVDLLASRVCEFVAPTDSALAPGSILPDASVRSGWLPGLGKAIVSCVAEPPVWPSGEATPVAAFDTANRVNDAYVGGKRVDMVVPAKDPTSFSVPDHGVGLVLTDLGRACGLGWVQEPGICNSLGVKLKHAQAALLAGGTQAGRAGLEAFRNELAAQRGKHVGELAFQLLDLNAGFILARL